jgi:hypothetical protein
MKYSKRKQMGNMPSKTTEEKRKELKKTDT